MGWFRRDAGGPEGFYTGDAPVSAPGVDGSSPLPYAGLHGGASGAPPGAGGDAGPPPAGPPFAGASHGSAPPPFGAYPSRPWTPDASAPPPRQMGRGVNAAFSIAGLLLVLVVAGGAAFVVLRTSPQDSAPPVDSPVRTAPATPGGRPGVSSAPTGSTSTAPTSTAPTATTAAGPPPITPQGEPATVQHGENSYRITVTSAAWQQVGAWDRSSVPSDVGHLTLDITVTRTDDAERASQISWFDWDFTAGAAGDPEVVGETGDLSGGGYGPELSTLTLEPGEKVSGTVAFEMTAETGTLRLRGPQDSVSGQWAVEVVQVLPAQGVLGEEVRTNAAELPFSATVSDPEWIAAGAEQLATDPVNGYLLILDATLTSRRDADSSLTSVWVQPMSWQFTPRDGRSSVGGYGRIDRMAIGDVEVVNGGSVDTAILLDVPGGPGTLALIGRDSLPVISWPIDGP